MIAIATIALGIGVNAGIFTILNGVLFRDLPAPDAHELVSITQTFEGVKGHATAGIGAFSTSEYRAYLERAQTLSGIAAFTAAPQTTLGSETPLEIFGATVSCNYFEVLQQPPALGRALTAQDCEPGAELVVVLGHDLWRTTFAADPQILGRTIVHWSRAAPTSARRFPVSARPSRRSSRFLRLAFFRWNRIWSFGAARL